MEQPRRIRQDNGQPSFIERLSKQIAFFLLLNWGIKQIPTLIHRFQNGPAKQSEQPPPTPTLPNSVQQQQEMRSAGAFESLMYGFDGAVTVPRFATHDENGRPYPPHVISLLGDGGNLAMFSFLTEEPSFNSSHDINSLVRMSVFMLVMSH